MPVTGPRLRPVLHFTATRGWINDPYGVYWDGEKYHLFYQAVPDLTEWAPQCAWGHATSPDLVHWDEQELALEPQAQELGCWSGSVVFPVSGPALAFYTRVRDGNLDVAQIAVATFDRMSGRFSRGRREVVVAGPPDGAEVVAFRDPYIWPGSTGWTMIVGAGYADGTGAVLRYRSADLHEWHFAGPLCRGLIDGTGSAAEVWECPQFLRVGQAWVLIVSLMKDGAGDHVAVAVGDYDGDVFTHSGWRRLAFGPAAYATSAFVDRDGEVGLISWLREDANGADSDETTVATTRVREWAGAHSIVSRLRLDATGHATVSPHPDVDRSIAPWLPGDLSETRARIPVGPGPVRVQLAPSGLRAAGFHDEAGCVLSVAFTDDDRGVDVVLADGRVGFMPAQAGAPTADIWLDAGIVEVFTVAAYAAWQGGRPAS